MFSFFFLDIYPGVELLINDTFNIKCSIAFNKVIVAVIKTLKISILENHCAIGNEDGNVQALSQT